jgi:hypothetical protein
MGYHLRELQSGREDCRYYIAFYFNFSGLITTFSRIFLNTKYRLVEASHYQVHRVDHLFHLQVIL